MRPFAALALAASLLAAQEPAPPDWKAPSAFDAPAGSQAARDAAAAAGEGGSRAWYLRRGRFSALPYPAGAADAFSRRLEPATAPELPAPADGPESLASWFPAAYRDGLDAAFAASMTALWHPSFTRKDGAPRPKSLERALEAADYDAGAWGQPGAPKGGRFERGVRAWAAFRAAGRGRPYLSQVARGELAAALAWCRARAEGRTPDRESLAVVAVAWMARNRPQELRSLPTLEVVAFKDQEALYGAVEASAGPSGTASLLASALPAGYREGGPEHKAAALALLDEAPEGAWGIPSAVRAKLRRASECSAYPLPEPAAVMEALDGITGMAEPKGSEGRAGDEEAVAAAFREPPPPVASARTVAEASRRLAREERELEAAKGLNHAMSEAIEAYDNWSSAKPGADKAAAAERAKGAAAALRAMLDKDGHVFPTATAAKGYQVADLVASKVGK